MHRIEHCRRLCSATLVLIVSGLAFGIPSATTAWAAGYRGKLELQVVDKTTGEPLAVRMHLYDSKGKPVRPPKVPYWHDHFAFQGSITLDLPVGTYTFEIERGPEYREQTGHFVLEKNAKDSKVVTMTRFVNMREEGWWSGDLHIHRPLNEIELLMDAEDLHIGPVITWWNDKNTWDQQAIPTQRVVEFGDKRFYELMAGEDEREGGALLYFGCREPLPLTGASREYPSPLEFLEQAKKSTHRQAEQSIGDDSNSQPRSSGNAQAMPVHVDIEKPFWWDMPIWVASGLADSIGLANNHLQRSGMLMNEAWGKPRDKVFYPDPHGNGRWSQAIYYHLLNCGLRIPPSAGSASGVLPNPVGYNRVYVHVDGELTWEKWWEGLRAGRVVITNGPMLRPSVNGELPGHVFEAAKGETVELNIALNLAMREKVEYLEVVKDGKIVHEVRLDEWAKKNGELPPVKFDQSGWLMVRAVTNNTKTYRFASTGPYYVQIGAEPRISRESAQFFSDWVLERAKRVKLEDASERESVIRHHRMARDFWKGVLERANSD